jgi:transposase
MRHVREVVRLKTAGVSGNEIARRLNLAPSTVRLTLQRLATAGLGWPLPTEMTETVLEARLFTAVGTKQGHRRHAEPGWAEIHRELKRKHVTLQILWDQYIERFPDGYRCSRLCELYRGWASRLSVTMRRSHAGGDKLFVDYAGDTVPVIFDRLTGKIRPAEIFVAVMAPPTPPTPRRAGPRRWVDGIGAHTRAFAALGGLPKLLVRLSKPASTSRRSIAPTPRWRRITILRSCRSGPSASRQGESRSCGADQVFVRRAGDFWSIAGLFVSNTDESHI